MKIFVGNFMNTEAEVHLQSIMEQRIKYSSEHSSYTFPSQSLSLIFKFICSVFGTDHNDSSSLGDR